jgi:hypothetical protein
MNPTGDHRLRHGASLLRPNHDTQADEDPGSEFALQPSLLVVESLLKMDAGSRTPLGPMRVSDRKLPYSSSVGSSYLIYSSGLGFTSGTCGKHPG